MTLTRFVAHRAVERVIGEYEFECHPTRGQNFRTVCDDLQPILNGYIAGYIDTLSIALYHFDFAHPAASSDLQCRVIAEVWNMNSDLFAGLEYVDPVRKIVLRTVNFPSRHRFPYS